MLATLADWTHADAQVKPSGITATTCRPECHRPIGRMRKSSLVMSTGSSGRRTPLTTIRRHGLRAPTEATEDRRLAAGKSIFFSSAAILRRCPPNSDAVTWNGSLAVVAGSHRFQNPCDGMRNARLKREDAFSHAMIIVSSAMVSSS